VGQDERRSEAVRALRDRYAHVAGHWVRWAWREQPSHAPLATHGLLRSVRHEIAARRRRRAIVRWTGRAVLSVTGLAAMVFLSGDRRPQLSSRPDEAAEVGGLIFLDGGDQATIPARRVRVESGALLAAPAGQVVRFGTADGTELTVESGARLTVLETRATKRFELLEGAVRVRVRKLRPGERFIVDTVDAEVEVRGTMFRVALSTDPPRCGPPTVSRVWVWEGVVAVRGPGGGGDVGPGEEWPPRCTAAVQPGEPDALPAAGVEPERRQRSLARSRFTRARSVAGSSGSFAAATVVATDLEAQNDLFAAAMRARRNGSNAQALRLFDHFIRSYPNAALLESAFVQRMRLLAASDARAAADAADRYLGRFPDGFAHVEAQLLRRAAGRP